MAHDAITDINMPELDAHAHHSGARAVLNLVTRKGMNGLHAAASIHFVEPNGITTFELCGDFREVISHDRTARGTQKAIDTLHADAFGAANVERIKDRARAFYVDKAIKKGGR